MTDRHPLEWLIAIIGMRNSPAASACARSDSALLMSSVSFSIASGQRFERQPLDAERILARLRHRGFYSLAELNAAINELLKRLNDERRRCGPALPPTWGRSKDRRGSGTGACLVRPSRCMACPAGFAHRMPGAASAAAAAGCPRGQGPAARGNPHPSGIGGHGKHASPPPALGRNGSLPLLVAPRSCPPATCPRCEAEEGERGTIRLRMVSPVWPVAAEIDEARLRSRAADETMAMPVTPSFEGDIAARRWALKFPA
jgi:hypothetical protein